MLFKSVSSSQNKASDSDLLSRRQLTTDNNTLKVGKVGMTSALLLQPSSSMMPSHLLHLQRLIGNAAVNQLFMNQQVPVIQRVIIGNIDVDTNGNMATWEQEGIRYHLNVKTDPYHVTQEGISTGKKKNITKTHYFFRRKNEVCEDAVGHGGVTGSKKKFSELPKSVQQFVESHFMDLIK